MISVILPVYNGESFLENTIQSILNQTETNFELIIINDGSTDNSEEVIKSFSDKRIRYFKQENEGAAAAKNEGLKHCRGEFITFHDADDLSLINRFEKLLQGFENRNIRFVHSDMLLVNEHDHPIGYWQSSNVLADLVFTYFINVGTPFNNPTIMYRENVVRDRKFLPYKIGEDTDFIMNIATKVPSFHVQEPIYLYRRHSNNTTNEYSYEEIAVPIRKFIEKQDSKLLLTEVNWLDDPEAKNHLRANLIIASALSRRGLFSEAVYLFEESIPLISNEEDNIFFEGMKALVENRFRDAELHLLKIKNRDHIVENYLGEALLHQKKSNQAYAHFMQALNLSPHYSTALQNLKAVGQKKGLHLIDQYNNKF